MTPAMTMSANPGHSTRSRLRRVTLKERRAPTCDLSPPDMQQDTYPDRPPTKALGGGRRQSSPRRRGPISTAVRPLDGGDVDLFHLHHRIERALGGSAVGIGERLGQGDRRNLPGQAPFVLAP